MKISGLSRAKRRLVAQLSVLLAASLVIGGCGTSDEATPGPDVGADGTSGFDGGDIGTSDTEGVDTVGVPQLDFYLSLKTGDALKDSNSVILATIQDKYPEEGFQADLVVTTTNLDDGTAVDVTIDGKSVGTGSISNGTVTITKVTLPCASVAQDIVVTADIASRTKSALVNCTGGCSATLKKVAACLSEDADPATDGFQVAFEVSTITPDCSDAYIKYTDVDGKVGESAKVPLNGQNKVTITVTLASKDKGLANASAQVQAFVIDSAFPTRPVGKSAQQTVKMTTDGPVIKIIQPTTDIITLADDANGKAEDGIQVSLIGSATTMQPLEPLEISVNGKSAGPVTVGANGLTFVTTLTFDKSQAYKVSAKATNSCGLSTTIEKTFTAFVDKASMVITKPAPNAVLLAKEDDDLSTPDVFETDMTVTVAKANDGDKVSVFCRPNVVGTAYGKTPVGTATYAKGSAGVVVKAKLSLSELTTAVACRASIDGPNPSTSAESSFVIGIPAPCLVIAQPLDNGAVKTATLPLTATGTHLEGRIVEAKVALKGGATFIDTPIGKIVKGVMNTNLTLKVGLPPAQLPDGVYTLTLSATDVFGNQVKDSACSDAVRTITLDTTAPKMAIKAPTKTSLDPLVDADTDTKTPGYQTDVVVAVSGETGVSDVCLKVNAFDLPCQKIVGAGDVTFAGVSLQPGANTLVVSGTDALGNSHANAAKTITLASNAVVVTWFDPKTNVSVASDSITVKAKISDQKNGAPISGAKVIVHIDGKAQPAVAVSESPSGVYSATVAGLKGGKNTLQFVATPQGSSVEGVSPLLVVTRKTGVPSVKITSPADKTLFNLASSACLAGVKDCRTTATVATSNAADDSEVSLGVTCAGKTKTYKGKVAAGKASFADVLFLHGQSCNVEATVIDEAGQQASSPAISVSTDRVAPRLISLFPTKEEFLTGDDFNNNPADGVQVLLNVIAAGLEKNSSVTLDIFDDTGKKTKSYASKNHPAVGDSNTASIGFGIVSLPDGIKVKLKLSATDAAGNVGSLEKVIKVVANAPEVRLGTPAYVAPDVCTSSASCGIGVCVAGKCAVGWNKLTSRSIGYATLGLLPGAKVRVCTNEPNTKGKGACKTPGFKAVTALTEAVLGGGTIAVPDLPDGDHTLVLEVILPGKSESDPKNWTASTESPLGDSVRSRRIYVDSVQPTIKAVLPPSIAGVPKGCLAAASQTKLDNAPGGSFTFAATIDNEEATISVFSAGTKVGAGVTNKQAAGVTVTLGAGSATLKAVAVDAVGNESAPFDIGTFNVNTVAPVGQFVTPNKAVLTKSDALDVKISSPSKDVEGQPVVLQEAAKTLGTVSMTKGAATFAHATYKALTDGSHKLTAVLKDECGNTAKIQTIPATVLVDTQGPTATIKAPNDKQVFGDNDDASKSLGGYQVNVSFSSSGAKTWKVELGVDCDAAFQNCSGFSPVASGKITNDGGDEPAVSTTIPFGKTNNYVARVTTTDANGNSTVVTRNFTVSLKGCKVLLSGVPASGILNTQSCATKGQDCASVKLPLEAEYFGPCGNVSQVRFTQGGNVVGSVQPANNKASFTLTAKDGDNAKIEAFVYAGAVQKGGSGGSPLKVDLTNPKVSFEAAKVLSFDTAASGATVTYGTGDDQDAAKNGIQVHAQIKVTDANLAGGSVTKLENVQGTAAALSSTLKLPFALTGPSAEQVSIKYITLAADATSKVQVTVADAAGNVSSTSFTAITDSTAPAAITLDPIAKADINPRRPFVNLKFKAVADNGATGVAAKSYEVRYARTAITSTADFEKACDAKVLTASNIGAPKAAGADEVVTIEGPDGRPFDDPCKFAALTDNGKSKFYFAVRAVDAAGNKGDISNVVSTADVRLHYAKITGSVAPYDNAFTYGFPHAIGDFNGDGKHDFALAGMFGAKLCVIFGHAAADGSVGTYDIKAQTGASHACLNNTVVTGNTFASGVDVNGDGLDDLVVDSGAGKGTLREIHIYLGNKAGKLSGPQVKLVNITNSGTNGVKALSAAGNFNGDSTAKGDAIDDIAFTITPTAAKLYDRVVLLPGNSKWNAGTQLTIDVEKAADRAANNMLTIRRSDSTSKPDFGYRLHKLGNFLPDTGGAQFDDLAISQYAATQTIYIVKGRALSGDMELTLTRDLTGAGTADKTTLALRPDGPGVNNPRTVVPVHFDGDKQLDLVFSHNPYKQVSTLYWVRGKDAVKLIGKLKALNLTAIKGIKDTYKHSLGYALRTYADPIFSLGNFGDQQGVAATTIGAALPFFAPGGRLSVTIRQPIVRPDGATGKEPSYHVADFVIGNPFAPGTPTFGAYLTEGVGDFNGDGFPDMVVGTFSGSKNTDYTVLVY